MKKLEKQSLKSLFSNAPIQCTNVQLVASHKEKKLTNEKVRKTKLDELFFKRTQNGEASKQICLQHTYQKTKFPHTLGNSVTFLLVGFNHNGYNSFRVAVANVF